MKHDQMTQEISQGGQYLSWEEQGELKQKISKHWKITIKIVLNLSSLQHVTFENWSSFPPPTGPSDLFSSVEKQENPGPTTPGDRT